MKNEQVLPLPIEQWPAELKHIINDMNAKPINVHALMANNPDLLKAWWDFRNYSVQGGSLGKRKAELVILRVAIHMNAWYEWGSHVERSLACGISLDEIERVNQREPDANWNVSEALLLLTVDQLISTHCIAPQLLKRLNEFYSTAQIMDLMAIHGMYVILGCMINTWGLTLDAAVNAKLPDTVTQEIGVPQLC
ncbi:MAG: 4-carboxymuconolactone decarboxylase [Oceanospirillaceae bacterium]|jgi:4-carboxymuconolactone decarboxylase